LEEWLFVEFVDVLVGYEVDVGIVSFVVFDLVVLCGEVHVESWSGLIDDDFEGFAGEKESAELTYDGSWTLTSFHGENEIV
jgi:hypothetical protein